MQVREPAVAGLFYPDDPVVLAHQVDEFVSRSPVAAGGPPAALIAPHAGYRFSGACAGRAYRVLVDHPRVIRRVVLLGPNHTVPLRGMAVTTADAWRTPLGSVTIDDSARDLIAHLVALDEAPHVREHSLEVHVPFLQRTLPSGWRLLPIVVGQCPPELVATVLDTVVDAETLVIASTDLSHFQDQASAVALDVATVEAVAAGSLDGLGPERACGFHPVRGLLRFATEHNYAVDLLSRCTSGDVSGDLRRVVGYASFTVGARSG